MNKDYLFDMAEMAIQVGRELPTNAEVQPAGHYRTVPALALSLGVHALFFLLITGLIGNYPDKVDTHRPLTLTILPVILKETQPSTGETAGPPGQVNLTIKQPVPAAGQQKTLEPLPGQVSTDQTPLPARPALPEVAGETIVPLQQTPADPFPAAPARVSTDLQTASAGHRDAEAAPKQAADRASGIHRNQDELYKSDQDRLPGQADQQEQTTARLTVTEARPLYLLNPRPEYPRQARLRHLQGLVILDILVTEQGAPADIRIFASSGHKVLDSAAQTAVGKWLFEPGRHGDNRVAMRVRVPVRFSLQ